MKRGVTCWRAKGGLVLVAEFVLAAVGRQGAVGERRRGGRSAALERGGAAAEAEQRRAAASRRPTQQEAVGVGRVHHGRLEVEFVDEEDAGLEVLDDAAIGP